MKVKIPFRRLLLPVRKQFKIAAIRSNFRKDPELYYIVGLVLLWLAVFIMVHIKYLNFLK